MKRGRRGTSSRLAKVGEAMTFKAPARPGTSAAAAAIISKAAVIRGSSASAVSVGLSPWARRTKSGTPKWASSSLTWRLTAPGETFSSSPARANPPRRAAASKARKALSGGRRMAPSRVKFPEPTPQIIWCAIAFIAA